MSRYFLSGTALAGVERMMQATPHFESVRGSGQREFKYSIEDCDCRYCTEYRKSCRGKNCAVEQCVCAAEKCQAKATRER